MSSVNRMAVKDAEQIQVLREWARKGFRGTAQLCTAFGKTFTAIRGACKLAKTADLNYRILILTPTEVLRDNAWVDEFKKWKETKVLYECVTIMCIQSAYKLKNTDWDLVIADEIHNYLSEEYSHFFFDNNIKKVIGLSAYVPEEYLHVLNKIAPIFYTITLNEAKAKGIVAPYKIFNISVKLNEQEREEYERADAVIKRHRDKLSDDFMRIPKYVRDAIQDRLDVIYNAEEKLNAVKVISDLFPTRDGIIFTKSAVFSDKMEEILAPHCVSYHSKQTKVERAHRLKRLRDGRTKINRISSIKALNEGVNIPSISLVFIAAFDSKIKNWIQQVGRGVRFEENKLTYVFNFYCANTVDLKTLNKRLINEDVNDIKWFTIDNAVKYFKSKSEAFEAENSKQEEGKIRLEISSNSAETSK